jgi:hypothetical protein
VTNVVCPTCCWLVEKGKNLLFSYLSIPYSFCPATYRAPIDGSVSINIVGPFMDVPHRFLHCNKELHYSAIFVYWRTNFVELQQRLHVSGTFANLYIE